MKIKIVKARPKDAGCIEELDRFGNFHPRAIEKYLSPVDQTKIGKYFIFLANVGGSPIGKVEMRWACVARVPSHTSAASWYTLTIGGRALQFS
jgi:hypothetical protein